MAAMALAGRVCIVTGASRGIGKGIALQLGEAGATVYITGRTLKTSDNQPGSLELTAQEIKERGGNCIPVSCDHTKDDEVKALFDRVEQEQNGRLDLLVNNAYAAVDYISNNMGVKFWVKDPAEHWDTVNSVGLRNHFLCTVYAARLMVAKDSGLIVNVSSAGGLKYLFNVPYGVGKQAVDRMAADCAKEMYRHKVAMVSLWPGAVRTEKIQEYAPKRQEMSKGLKTNANVEKFFENGETPEYAGKCIVNLAKDPNILLKTGKILLSRDLGDEYGFVDVDGRQPYTMRGVSNLLEMQGYRLTSMVFPSWIKIPRWMLHMAGNKL